MSFNSRAVFAQEETHEQFFARTRADWVRLARHLMARCRVPEGVDEDDVVQELQIAAWRVLGKFDPARGAKPDQFLMFNSIVRAKRWIKRQARRGGLEVGDARLVSSAELEGDEHPRLPEPAVDPAQEDEAARADELRRLLDGCASIRTKIVLVAAWQLGDVDAAGRAIYEDRDLRLKFRLDCRGDARRVVVKEIKRALEETTT